MLAMRLLKNNSILKFTFHTPRAIETIAMLFKEKEKNSALMESALI